MTGVRLSFGEEGTFDGATRVMRDRLESPSGT